jgi:hypothetical protein
MGIKVKDLREWLKIVPEEYDDCQVVYREIMPATSSDNTDEMMAIDTPITAATIDTSEREACFYDEKSYQLTQKIQETEEEQQK